MSSARVVIVNYQTIESGEKNVRLGKNCKIFDARFDFFEFQTEIIRD